MSKKYICYVVICNNNLGYVLEDNNKINKYYSSFENLIKYVDIDFQSDNSNSISLNECEIIFQFQIEKMDGDGDSDSALNMEVKLEIPTIVYKSKQCFEELKKRLEFDDKKVKYSIIIDDGEPAKQTLLEIFELIFGIFFLNLNLDENEDSLADILARSGSINEMSDREREKAMKGLGDDSSQELDLR